MPQLLPPGKQTFFYKNGSPLANGTVGFYSPGTLNFKTTWSDSNGNTPNLNPIQLDSNGQAVIYGAGPYRQVVKDVNGVVIWDQPVSDNTPYPTSAAMAPVVAASSIPAAMQLLSGTTSSRNSNTDITFSDMARCLIFTGTFTQTFVAAAILGDGFYFSVINAGTGTITFDPNGSEVLNGNTTFDLLPGWSGRIWCNGTAFYGEFNRSDDMSVAPACLFDNVTDDSTNLQAVLNAAAVTFNGGNDVGGGGGNVVMMPKGTAMIGSGFKIPDSVKLRGKGPYSTVLRMSNTFDPNSHFITLGETSPSDANFDTCLEDVQLFSGITTGNSGKAMVFTKGAQHTSGLRRVKIFGGARHCVRIEEGTGGAAYIMFDEVETFNKYNFASNAQWYVDYAGPLIVIMRGISTAGPSDDTAGPGSVCMLLKGGIIDLDGFHCEHIKRGIVLNKSGANSLYADLNKCTGNSAMDDLIRIESVDTGTIKLGVLNANGATNVVNNVQDGSTITGRIVMGPYLY